MPKKVKKIKKLKKFKSFKSVKASFYTAIRKANKKRCPSSLELLVYSWLEEDGISFKKEKAIGKCHVDIYLEPNIICEISGCYWHRNVCCYPENSKKNLATRLKDAKRFAFFKSKGFEVVVFRECEIKSAPFQVRSELRKLANVY